MPGSIDQCMHDGRSKYRIRLAPCPAIKDPRNRCEDYVPPIRKTHIGDVRKAEQHRSRPPSGQVALAGPRKHVLQQAAKQKFLRPCGEEENCNVKERERTPRMPLWRKINEMHADAKRYRDGAEHHKAGHNEKSPSA